MVVLTKLEANQECYKRGYGVSEESPFVAARAYYIFCKKIDAPFVWAYLGKTHAYIDIVTAYGDCTTGRWPGWTDAAVYAVERIVRNISPWRVGVSIRSGERHERVGCVNENDVTVSSFSLPFGKNALAIANVPSAYAERLAQELVKFAQSYQESSKLSGYICTPLSEEAKAHGASKQKLPSKLYKFTPASDAWWRNIPNTMRAIGPIAGWRRFTASHAERAFFDALVSLNMPIRFSMSGDPDKSELFNADSRRLRKPLEISIEQWIPMPDETNYRADFFHLPTNTAIEIDGRFGHDLTQEDRINHYKRERNLRSVGVRLVRFASGEVLDNPTAAQRAQEAVNYIFEGYKGAA